MAWREDITRLEDQEDSVTRGGQASQRKIFLLLLSKAPVEFELISHPLIADLV